MRFSDRKTLESHWLADPCAKLRAVRSAPRMSRCRSWLAEHVRRDALRLEANRRAERDAGGGRGRQLQGVGKFWQITACDAACSYGVAWLLPPTPPRRRPHVLRRVVLRVHRRRNKRPFGYKPFATSGLPRWSTGTVNPWTITDGSGQSPAKPPGLSTSRYTTCVAPLAGVASVPVSRAGRSSTGKPSAFHRSRPPSSGWTRMMPRRFSRSATRALVASLGQLQ